MNIQTKGFRLDEGTRFDFSKWPTRVKAIYNSKKQYKPVFNKHIEELHDLQRLLYASNRYGLLLTFQTMDAVGKDGTIRHLLSGVHSLRLPGVQLQASQRDRSGP